MKLLSSVLFATSLHVSSLFLFAAEKSTAYAEGISFEIKTIALEHQGPNVVNLKVHFTYAPNLGEKEYPDFEPLQPFAATFLKDYPNNGDYWEVVLKKLATAYLEKAPLIAGIALEMQVSPTKNIPYYHTLHCTATREK